MSLSSCNFQNDIHDSKMEVAIIFWNFYSQPGFVMKEVEVVRAKGEKSEVNLCQKVVQKRSKNVKCGCRFFLLLFFFFNFCMVKA